MTPFSFCMSFQLQPYAPTHAGLVLNLGNLASDWTSCYSLLVVLPNPPAVSDWEANKMQLGMVLGTTRLTAGLWKTSPLFSSSNQDWVIRLISSWP